MAGLEALFAPVPLSDRGKWVFKIIVLIEVVLKGGCDSGNRMEGVDFIIVEATEIEGGDVVTM